MWREPNPRARYIMGMDPSVGITGWHRSSRTDDDYKTDNGAIEIFEVDAARYQAKDDKGQPLFLDKAKKQPVWIYQDVQVAEYFAPVDAVEIARVCWVLGNVYRGNAEEQCELIFEAQPGPGILSTQELLRLNYNNLWHWEIIGGTEAEETRTIGWRAFYESNRLLWYRTRRHMLEDRAVIYSPYLFNEWGNAQIDADMSFIKAHWGNGVHDDLVKACSLAFWAGHKWEYQEDNHFVEPVMEQAEVDWQHRAPTMDDGERMTYKQAKEMWG